jgi:hypothetical protein
MVHYFRFCGNTLPDVALLSDRNEMLVSLVGDYSDYFSQISGEIARGGFQAKVTFNTKVSDTMKQQEIHKLLQ